MNKKRVLVTGASGLLGHYLIPILKDWEIVVLGRSEECGIQCDLEQKKPHFTDVFPTGFDLVVHAAGTLDNARAISINLDGTRHLLEGLKEVSVRQFVYISSTDVYGKNEGADITEEDHLWSADKVGQSKALAEEEVRKFCDEMGIICTILRPATMFGKGMKGWGQRMAGQVLVGTYLNVRDADAAVSLVTAYDVARLIPLLAPVGGIYNVTDGLSHSLQDLAMAMGNNRGRAKKPFFLPMKWAKLLGLLGDRLPLIDRILDTRELARRTTSLTFSSRKLREALPDFRFHDTAAVVGRTDTDFPYEDD